MGILNNIWTLLTTENEFVTSVVTFPLCFIETYLTLYMFRIFLKMNITKKQQLSYIIFISLVIIFTNLFVCEPFNVIINYGIVFLILYICFKQHLIKSVIAIVISFGIYSLCGSLIMNPILKLFKIEYYQLSSIPLYKIVYLILMYLLIDIFILIFKQKNIYLNLFDKLYKNIVKTIIINLLFAIMTLIIQLFLTFYYISIVPISITLFNFILLFLYIFISFYSLTKVIKLNITTQNLENAESYNKSLTVLYDNVRGFKHDFDNMLNTLGGYIEMDDMEGLKKYYSNLKGDCIRVKNIQLLNPNVINNPGIYNLIVSEYQKATDLNIKINFEFFFDFNNLNMPIYEFSKILGILLDNAIDATKDCDNKEISLRFRDSRKQRVQIVIVENTYNNKEVDISKIFDKGFSGKENHSGIGLWEVKQIEKNFNNIILHTSKDNEFFKQQLEIYY